MERHREQAASPGQGGRLRGHRPAAPSPRALSLQGWEGAHCPTPRSGALCYGSSRDLTVMAGPGSLSLRWGLGDPRWTCRCGCGHGYSPPEPILPPAAPTLQPAQSRSSCPHQMRSRDCDHQVSFTPATSRAPGTFLRVFFPSILRKAPESLPLLGPPMFPLSSYNPTQRAPQTDDAHCLPHRERPGLRGLLVRMPCLPSFLQGPVAQPGPAHPALPSAFRRPHLLPGLFPLLQIVLLGLVAGLGLLNQCLQWKRNACHICNLQFSNSHVFKRSGG